MKKTGFIFFVIGLIFFGTGCATSGKAALVAQKDPIALVSFISNEDVNWSGEEPIDPNVTGPLIRRALRLDPDMTTVTNTVEFINTAENIFRNILADSGLFILAGKEAVLQSASYQNARERRFPNRNMVKPEGYRFIDFRDKKFHSALAEETGIQRSMHIEFNFTKFLYTGVSFLGNCRAEVEMTVIILDAAGKILYRKTNSMVSASSVRISSGVYSQSAMLNSLEETVNDVIFEFLAQFN